MATPTSKADTRRQLLAAIQACEDKKGEDTRILELDPVDSGLADFFLITSAANDRQVIAIADEIEFRLKKEFGLYATSVEGRRQGEWVLLDYIDIVIHVFLAEKRAFYDIERLRKSARPMTPADVDAEVEADRKSPAVRKLVKTLAQKTRAVRSTQSKAKPASPRSTKETSKGDSTLPKKSSAKPAPKKTAKAAVKAAAKPAAKAPAKTANFKPVKEKPVAKPSPAKAAKKSATKSAPAKVGAIAPRPTAPIAPSQGAKPPVVKCEAPPEAVAAPQGVKPPVVKGVDPGAAEPLSLAASTAPARKAAKKAAAKTPVKVGIRKRR